MKSTTAQAGWKVQIHGHRQLEKPPHGDLYLIAVRFEISPEGDRFLGDQIARLMSAGVDESLLWNSLNDSDVYEYPPEELERFRFFLRDTAVFHVDSLFPRVTPEMFKNEKLPDRVSDLGYVVDLTGYGSLDQTSVFSSLGLTSEQGNA